MLVTFDTLEYVKELKESGFTDQQADGLAKAQKKVMTESMDNTLATKEDIHEVIDHIKDFKSELIIECESIKARLSLVEKMQWALIAGVIAIVLKTYFL